jgi:hypothetical protein
MRVAVISCGDSAPIFQPAEHALDDVSAFVSLAVEWIGRSPRGCGRNDGFDLFSGEPFAQTVGVVSFVRQEPLWSGGGAEQRDGHGDVGDVSRRQREADRPATIIGQSMDFACSSATRATDRFGEFPLFEPAAERCALTWLESMESSSGTGPAAAIFSKIRCQMRRCDQRL